MVWNDNPKPGETATWFGDRDAEGYATKVGTITWYTARGTVYARFRGNMIRGKFNGTVNGYSKGKTAHAVFVDGQRTRQWMAGIATTYGTPLGKMPTNVAKNETDEARNASHATAPADLQTEMSQEEGSEMVGPSRASPSDRQPYSS